MLRAHAALHSRRPLVHIGLDGRQQGRVFGGGGDVQVQVTITWWGKAYTVKQTYCGDAFLQSSREIKDTQNTTKLLERSCIKSICHC